MKASRQSSKRNQRYLLRKKNLKLLNNQSQLKLSRSRKRKRRLRSMPLISLREKNLSISQRLLTKRSLKNIESNINFSKKCRGKLKVMILIKSRCQSSRQLLLKCLILVHTLLSITSLRRNNYKFHHFRILFQLLLFNIKL